MKRTCHWIVAALTVIGFVASPAGAKTAEVAGAVVDCSAASSCTITWDEPSDVTVFVGTAVDEIDHDADGIEAAGNAVTIPDLDPSKRYYFELVPTGADAGTIVADRSLGLPTSPNSRDIGGYETEDGRHVKWGTLFRSEEIIELTDAELLRLSSFGIKVVCDFRGTAEIEKRGEDQLPEGAEYVHLPVLDEDNTLPVDIENAIVNKDFEAQERLLGEGRGAQILLDQADFLVDSKAALKAYTALLDRLTNAESLPTFTHCTTGKDRTGWSTAIILTALGVPRETIIEDYMLTNVYAAPKNEERKASAASLMEHPEYLQPLLYVQPEFLEASFDAVDEQYGSFANYLRKGLKVSKADLKKLKKNLLTD